MNLHALSLLSFCSALCVPLAPAQAAECPAGSPDLIIEVIERMPNCDAAYKVFESCSYGSSMDVQFGAAVTTKCEGMFLIKLSARQRTGYDEMQGRCSRKYRNRVGTIYQSFESFCHADVARRYARRLAPRPAQSN